MGWLPLLVVLIHLTVMVPGFLGAQDIIPSLSPLGRLLRGLTKSEFRPPPITAYSLKWFWVLRHPFTSSSRVEVEVPILSNTELCCSSLLLHPGLTGPIPFTPPQRRNAIQGHMIMRRPFLQEVAEIGDLSVSMRV